MNYKYWKLAAAILFLTPVVAFVGYLLWLVTPTVIPVAVELYRSPGTWILVGVFILAAIIIGLLAAGLHFWEGYKFDSEIDDTLKKNLKPEAYKAYREYTGIKSIIRRWRHGGDKAKEQNI